METISLQELLGMDRGLENCQLPDPFLLNQYELEKNRIIYIDTGIDQSVLEIEKKILLINREDKDIPVENRKPIKICIYSYG